MPANRTHRRIVCPFWLSAPRGATRRRRQRTTHEENVKNGEAESSKPGAHHPSKEDGKTDANASSDRQANHPRCSSIGLCEPLASNYDSDSDRESKRNNPYQEWKEVPSSETVVGFDIDERRDSCDGNRQKCAGSAPQKGALHAATFSGGRVSAPSPLTPTLPRERRS